MQKLRLVHGAKVRETAAEFGCSPSHISRVERGDTKPSRALVQFYEDRFEGDGLLLSLFEVAEHANEQKRQRGRRGIHIPLGCTSWDSNTVLDRRPRLS